MRDQILKLPSIKQTVSDNELFAKKSLGQNFIFDLNITDKICRASGDLKDKFVIEIGPGPGSLTRSILMQEPYKLVVVERDEKMQRALSKLKEIAGDKFEILMDDALEVSEEEIIKKYNIENKPVKIISNLPYNIGTELLFKWLEKIELFESLTLMFQKEVADRIASKNNSKAFSKLSVISQYLCNVEKVFDLPPTIFYPPPKVDSAIIQVTPRAHREIEVDVKKLKKVCEIAFNQRRKTLRNTMKKLFPNPAEIIESLGFKPEMRPEEMTVNDFCRLALRL
jgi:16S rRNA (adenine1518-N6/adenine1519-N6)-dimethyltransferase